MITMDKILEHPRAPFELCDAFVKTTYELTPNKVLVLYKDERMDGCLCALVIAGDEDNLEFGQVCIITSCTVSSPCVESFEDPIAKLKYETEEGVRILYVGISELEILPAIQTS